jgi:hypothetical protein
LLNKGRTLACPHQPPFPPHTCPAREDSAIEIEPSSGYPQETAPMSSAVSGWLTELFYLSSLLKVTPDETDLHFEINRR